MPPKKAGGKAAKGKATTEISGLPTDTMSIQQLEEQIIQLREELEKEQKERNYFQLERDKIHTFWEITKDQLEEKKAELMTKELEIEEAEQRHQAETKLFNQKVKHLQFEQQTHIAKLKAEEVIATKLQEKEQIDLETELRRKMRELTMDMQEQKLSYENYIKNLNLSHDNEITKLRSKFEKKVQENEAGYERKLKKQREEQDLRRKTECHEIIQRKTIHSNTLIRNHDKSFNDMKNYYNEVNRVSVNHISSLQEQVEEMKKTENRLKREVAQVREQNKRLTEPLQKATEEASELKKQLTVYNVDRAKLARVRTRLKVVEKELKDLKMEHVVLEEAFIMVQQKRDDLNKKFNKVTLELQQKNGFKNLLLEKKLNALNDTVVAKETQLNEVLAACNLQPSALNVVTHKLVRHMRNLVETMKADIEKGSSYLDQPKMLKYHYKTLQKRYPLNEEDFGKVPITNIPGEVTEEITTRVDRVGQVTAPGNGDASEILDTDHGPSA
ncbi:dynein regulatory complex subunit 4-like [Tachysurus ichikawai]